MTVAELIEQLRTFNQNDTVVVDARSRYFTVDCVYSQDMLRARGGDYIPARENVSEVNGQMVVVLG